MPSERTRRKDDTWTTDELNRALKRDDPDRRRHRDRDDRRHRDDDDRRRRHRDDVNGDSDDRRRKHKDEDRKSHREASEDKRRHRKDRSPDEKIDLTEAEREKLRRERRERREKKEPTKSDRKEKKRDAPVIDDDDDGRRRHRDRDDERRKQRDDDRERRHKDDDKRHKRDDDDRKRHRDDDDRRHHRDEDSRRRHRDDAGDSRRKHKEDDNRRRHRDEDDRDKRRRERHDEDGDDRERQRQERRERKEKKDKRNDREEEKKDRGKEERGRRDRYEDKEEKERTSAVKKKKVKKIMLKKTSSRRKKDPEPEPEPEAEEDGDDYNYDDDDFEDYDDDFEDDEDEEVSDDKPKEAQSEMDALMRAMDEENNRLTNGSRRSNRSDETDESEDRYRPPPPKATRGRTFIDFVSAKQVALSSKTASRTRKRGEDLLQMIELDKARYDMFDLPPVREYEMYIRSFGRSNTKQAYVQTNEDNIDRDIQTDDIDSKEKWTQHPADDLMGVGGDGIDPEAGKDSQIISRHGDTVKLAKFVEKAGQAMGMLLDEEREGTDGQNQANTKSNVGFSDGFSELGRPKFLGDRYVTHTCFCPSQPNMLLTVFSSPTQPSMENPIDSHGLVCSWNVSDLTYPHRILCCEAQPTCCCYSPTRASLAFCGMLDGSVVVWDLRETASMHRTVRVQEEEYLLRFPTYNTARVLEEDNHHSPVTTIIPVYSTTQGSKSEESSDTSTGLSFQLATVEQSGIVNLWVVAEISNPDMAGSEVDLGLAPGGKIKLLKSSSIVLHSPNKAIRTSGSIQAFEMQFMPTDLNHFYVGTDTGCVVHGVRFGSRGFPHSYTPIIGSPINVTTIDFSPFGSPYFLAGCDDGSLYLYHTKSENPLLSWPIFCKGCGVRCVRWSRNRPAVFYVLDESSTIHVMDLLESDSIPIQRDQITSGRVISMCLANQSKLGSSRSSQLLLALETGRTEVHSIVRKLTEVQTLEEDFIEKYIDKF